MTKYLLDTNVLLRLLLGDVKLQYKKATKLFEDASNGKLEIYIVQIVIFEIDFGLTKFYKFNKRRVVDMLESLVGLPYVKLDNRDIFQNAIRMYKQASLDLVDCFLLTFSKEKDLKLYTFDKKLQKTKQ